MRLGLLAILTLLFILGLVVQGITITREKTVQNNGYLYRFVVTNLFEPGTWVRFDQAEGECKRWGGHLASIHSSSEKTFLKNLVTTRVVTYIGHDVSKWTDGTPVDFTAWSTHLGDLTFKHSKSDRRRQPAFICKKKVPPLTIAYEKTVNYDGFTYRYVVTPTHTSIHWVDFYKAEKECVKWGGHLTSIHSLRELNFLKGLVTRNALTYIGFDINKWTDETPVDYSGWKTQLFPRLTYKGGSINSKQPAFICRKKLFQLKIAYEKTANYGGFTYRYVVTPTHTSIHWVRFYQAEKECTKWGGHLTSIHSSRELNFLKELVTRNALTYIGFDINKWTDGTPVDYTAWKTQLRPRLTYKSGSINAKQPAFVCRKRRIQIAYQRVVTFSSFTYRYVVTPTHTPAHWINFHSAEDECKSWGGHLTSIHSNQELNFLKTLITKNALTYVGFDVNRWTDSTPVNFSAWKQFQRLTYRRGSSSLQQPAFVCRK